mmetsp:Transcript_108499/g.171505  ORF Transcript_108499/g.171505 Transcript_108499/m.171505 type:complete len:233 (-) Transcript_108499:62-760(-)
MLPALILRPSGLLSTLRNLFRRRFSFSEAAISKASGSMSCEGSVFRLLLSSLGSALKYVRFSLTLILLSSDQLRLRESVAEKRLSFEFERCKFFLGPAEGELGLSRERLSCEGRTDCAEIRSSSNGGSCSTRADVCGLASDMTPESRFDRSDFRLAELEYFNRKLLMISYKISIPSVSCIVNGGDGAEFNLQNPSCNAESINMPSKSPRTICGHSSPACGKSLPKRSGSNSI